MLWSLGVTTRTTGSDGRSGGNGRAATSPVGHELVFLDHGMSRRLADTFRSAYSSLFLSLLLDDEAAAQAAMAELDIPPEVHPVLAVALTFRLPRSSLPVGERGGKASRAERAAKVRQIIQSAGDLNELLSEGLPRDLLFVLRASLMVQSTNARLGGTTATRLRIFGELAARGCALRRRLVSMEGEASDAAGHGSSGGGSLGTTSTEHLRLSVTGHDACGGGDGDGCSASWQDVVVPLLEGEDLATGYYAAVDLERFLAPQAPNNEATTRSDGAGTTETAAAAAAAAGGGGRYSSSSSSSSPSWAMDSAERWTLLRLNWHLWQISAAWFVLRSVSALRKAINGDGRGGAVPAGGVRSSLLGGGSTKATSGDDHARLDNEKNGAAVPGRPAAATSMVVKTLDH